MFDKDIQHYIGADGELTEEAAIKLYGRGYIYRKPLGVIDGCFTAIRVFTLTFFSCAVFSCIGIIALTFILGALTSTFGLSQNTSPTPASTGNQTQRQVEGITNPRFVHCLNANQERILFTARDGATTTLYAMNPGELNTTCEMNASIRIGDPSRSHDGGRIAYETPNTGMIGILYLSSYNSQQIRQPDGYSNLSALAWSPDGNQVVVQANKDHECSNLLIGSLDGTYQEITSGEACDITPDWSPNGVQILFARAEHSNVDLEIFSYNLITHRVRQLTDNGLQDYGPVWSPDGIRIVFASEDGIYIMDANGANLQRLIDFGQWPTWSPDGTQIAFVSNYENPNGDETALFIANSDGSGIRRVTEYINANHPDWGP